ncbi:MAG: ATP-binding protein [Candidatus Aenigmarchaeota archaeon]|nr:ATP-binding protein [Candidatus Aenigmarchaeota archaeon]
MEKRFYDRRVELKQLTEKFGSMKGGELIVMYGRRRVGKTEIIKRFLETIEAKKLYYYVDLVERPVLISGMQGEIGKQIGEAPLFNTWDDFFAYIIKESEKGKFVLAIDEFQRFLQVSPDFITKLQRYWDESLKYSKIMILIVGSSIGMMEKIGKSYASPLYGRVTSRIKISPFRYVDMREMFRNISEEERVRYFAVFGGTPYYLAEAKNGWESIEQSIVNLMLLKGGKLFDEPAALMESEKIRTHARYNSILQAISAGKEITREMEDFTNIKSTTLPAYLQRMELLLDIVQRKNPVLGKERLGRYTISDNFYKFWYKFVFPNKSDLNMGKTNEVKALVMGNLNAYIARAFEGVVHEMLHLYNGKQIKGLEIDFEEVGNWWDRKSNEIDIVAYNRKKGTVLLGEVKWTNEKIDVDVFDDLVRKSKLVNFRGMAKFIMVSKNGFTKRCIEKMEQMHCVYLNLADIEKLFDDADKKGKYDNLL